MTNPAVFDEPKKPSAGPFHVWAEWLRSDATPEAREARGIINTWYANFPDRDGMLLSRLRLDDENEIAQAWDELYVHQLLSQSCEARYEEDQTSPDFRLYRASEYVGGIEAVTLFQEAKFSSEGSRNSRLVDEINRRVRPTRWYVSFDVRRWNSQPRATHIAKWLESVIATLGEPASDIGPMTYPQATYSTPDVVLEFTFFPRSRIGAPKPSEPLVLAGPVMGGFIQSDRRIRDRLSKKVGGKYDLRDKPFAVALTIRDLFCDIETVVNALYGDEAIVFRRDDPESARSTRKANGVFGISPANPEGRNRRLSCVFVFTRGWTPRTHEAPQVLRFDNPWAEHPFPDDLLATDRRFVAQRNEAAIVMRWEPDLGGDP